MKEKYFILIFNFYQNEWEELYSTDNLKLAMLKLRQYRLTYKYQYYKILKEMRLDV